MYLVTLLILRLLSFQIDIVSYMRIYVNRGVQGQD